MRIPYKQIPEHMMTTTMTLISEYETGTSSGRVHPHNGYYAGDFTPRSSCPTTRSAGRTRSTAAHQTLTRMAALPRR